MAIVTALAVSLIASIIAIELYFAFPKASDWLLRIATRRLSGPMKERCFEEWKAQLADIDSPLLRLLHAVSLIARANTVLQEDIDGYFRALDADLDGIIAQTKKSARNRFKHSVKVRTSFNRMRIRFVVARVAIFIAVFAVRGKKSARLLALPMILSKVTPLMQSLSQFQTAALDAFKVVAAQEAAIKAAVRKVRAERNRAAAAFVRSGDYETSAPVIAAQLQKKLGADMIEIRKPSDAKTQVLQAMKAGLDAMASWKKPDVEEIRKLR